MGDNAAVAVTLPPSAFRNPAAFSSSLRFLGLLKQPDSDLSSADPDSSPHHPFDDDLDEGEVIWSSSAYAASSPADDAGHRLASGRDLVLPDRLLSASSASYKLRRPFVPERCGLSAILADDRLHLVQRRRPAVAARAALPMAVPAAGRAVEAKAKATAAGSKGVRYQSAPVNVQAWPKWKKGPKAGALEEPISGDEAAAAAEGTEEMVPPHVMVARSQTTTFSVFEGVGRTLKGRDLRRVRNAVLQKTGFLDL